jgi:thymidylate synthase ThyX
MNFVNLRCDESAQWEIRQYANRIALFFSEKMPWTFSAFLEFAFTGKSSFIRDLGEQCKL